MVHVDRNFNWHHAGIVKVGKSTVYVVAYYPWCQSFIDSMREMEKRYAAMYAHLENQKPLCYDTRRSKL